MVGTGKYGWLLGKPSYGMRNCNSLDQLEIFSHFSNGRYAKLFLFTEKGTSSVKPMVECVPPLFINSLSLINVISDKYILYSHAWYIIMHTNVPHPPLRFFKLVIRIIHISTIPKCARAFSPYDEQLSPKHTPSLLRAPPIEFWLLRYRFHRAQGKPWSRLL
jgi:hypothetical protein